MNPLSDGEGDRLETIPQDEIEKILSPVYFSQCTGMRCRIEYRELGLDEKGPIFGDVLCQRDPGMKDTDRWKALRTPTDRDWRESKKLGFKPPTRTSV